MEDCVDNLGSARYVSKLDLLKGYWQVPLPLVPLIFQTLWLPIVFTVLCYGFRDTQSTCYFPATHYCAFRGFKLQCLPGWSSCVFYKLVRTCFSVKDCIRRSRQCFIDFELGKVWIWPSTYLGKELGQGQVRPLEAKVTAIAEFLITTTGQELRWYFVMAGYYCSFCNNFSIIVQPLTSLLSPLCQFLWSDECQHALSLIKTLRCSAPVLMAPNLASKFKLEVNASAIGAAIDYPVCYFSHTFNNHPVNYVTIEKEALALFMALQYFDVYFDV